MIHRSWKFEVAGGGGCAREAAKYLQGNIASGSGTLALGKDRESADQKVRVSGGGE